MFSSSDKEQRDCRLLRCFRVAHNTCLIFHPHVSMMRQFQFSPSDPIWVPRAVSCRAVCLCGVTLPWTGPDMKTTVSMLMWDTQSHCGLAQLPHTSATTCPLLEDIKKRLLSFFFLSFKKRHLLKMAILKRELEALLRCNVKVIGACIYSHIQYTTMDPHKCTFDG